MGKLTNGGLGNEEWWKSRRVYSAVLSVACIVAIFFEQPQIAGALATAAGGFGITSWVKVK